MKVPVAPLAVLAILAAAHPAQACEPATSCDPEYCWSPLAVVGATIVDGPMTDGAVMRETVRVDSAFGDTTGLAVGTNVTLETTWMFYPQDIGKPYVLYIERTTAGTLSIAKVIDRDTYFVTDCFGSASTAADIAAVVLSDTCAETFAANPPPLPKCPSAEGPLGCSASGNDSPLPLALVLGAIVLQPWRRRRVLRLG